MPNTRCEKCGTIDDVPSAEAGGEFKCRQCGTPLVLGRDARQTIIQDASPSEADADGCEEIRTLLSGKLPKDASEGMTIKSRTQVSRTVGNLNVRRQTLAKPGEPTPSPAEYELVEALGKGGMGVVYTARQTSLNRTIALKMIKADAAKDETARSGFLAEASVTGELEHPNIVPVYELGANEDGALFYAMKRVEGTGWNDVIGGKSQAENLDILMRVADAVAFAHSRGVIHRDLKPENVMLGSFGEVLVMDWGLAATVGKDGGIDANMPLCGTPAYMAPEMAQADRDLIGFHSDVYLLGAILFEIATGKRPHHGKSVPDCILVARRNKIRPADRDNELVRIALKAMATDPAERYRDVKAFQAAIREHQAHSESTVLSGRAREHLAEADKTGNYEGYRAALAVFEEALALWPGNRAADRGVRNARLAYAQFAFDRDDLDLAESLLLPSEATHKELSAEVAKAKRVREARRKRAKVLAISTAALLAVVFIGALFYNFRLAAAKKRIATALDKEAAARAESEDERRQAIQARDRAETAEAETLAKHRELLRETYAVKASLAHQRIADGAMWNAEALLDTCPKDFRGWEWGYMKGLCRQDSASFKAGSSVHSVDISPDGKRFACGTVTGMIIEGTLPGLVTTSGFRGHTGPIYDLKFSPNGSRLATASADRTLKVWGGGTERRLLFRGDGHKHPLFCLDWSSDGRRLLSADRSGTIICSNARNGKILSKESRKSHPFFAGWLPDNERCVILERLVGGAGLRVQHVTKPALGPSTHQKLPAATFATMDKAGQRVAMGNEVTGLSVVAVATGKVLKYHKASGGIHPDSACFSPNGDRIAIGSKSGLVAVLGATTGDKPYTLRGHTRGVRCLAFTPDGQSLLTGSKDRTLKLWDLRPSARGILGTVPEQRLFGCAIASDGARIAASGRRLLRIWEVASAKEVLALDGLPDTLLAIDFGPEGDVICVGHDKGRVEIRDTSTGRPIRELQGSGSPVWATAFSPDGKHIAAGDGSGTVKLWKAESGELVSVWTVADLHKGRPRRKGTRAVRSLDFDGSGKRLAVGCIYEPPVILSVPTLQIQALTWEGTRLSSRCVAFSPDGSMLAVASHTPGLHVYDSQTGKLKRRLSGQPFYSFPVAYHPGGKRLLSADHSGFIYLWDVEAGREILRWKAHEGVIKGITCTPDGNTLITFGSDGKVRIWRGAASDGTAHRGSVRKSD